MIKIKLKSGREVGVDSFHFNYTYGGLLVGIPHERMNIEYFEKKTYPKNWGKGRKLLKIKPNPEDFKNRLKPIYYSVWLDSKPFNPKYFGSSLIVTWFGNEPNGKTIDEIIQTGIENIDWIENAHDYDP
jgi:hypothetical protein